MINISFLFFFSEGHLWLVLLTFLTAFNTYCIVFIIVWRRIERVQKCALRFLTATKAWFRLVFNSKIDLLHDHFAIRACNIKAVWICGTELLRRRTLLFIKDRCIKACSALPSYLISTLAKATLRICDQVRGRVISCLFHLSFFSLTIAASRSRFDNTSLRYWADIVQFRLDKGSNATLALKMATMTSGVVTLTNIEQFEVLLAPIVSWCVHPFMSFDQRLLLSIIFSEAILFWSLDQFTQTGIVPNITTSKVLKRSHSLHLHYQNKDISTHYDCMRLTWDVLAGS